MKARFRDSFNKSLTALKTVRYIVRNTQLRRNPAEYISTIVLNVKNASIAITKAAQILLIYKYIDSELRRNLSRFRENFIIAELLEKLRY